MKAYTLQELFAKVEADRRAQARSLRWGSWRLDPRTWTLSHDFSYEIYLDEIRNSATMLDWIFQIRNKRWATDEVMGDLLRALYDIFDPQANYCSWGDDRDADPKRLISAFAALGRSA